jgi:hypothetical protein
MSEKYNSTDKLFSKIINNTKRLMNEYQKKKGVKGECIQNASYLYGFIKNLFKNENIERIKIKPVIAVYKREYNDEKVVALHIHMIILIDDMVIDPSYEINHYEKKAYYDNWSVFISDIPDQKNNKKLLMNYLSFGKNAERIMKYNGLILNEKIYREQIEYITKNSPMFYYEDDMVVVMDKNLFIVDGLITE